MSNLKGVLKNYNIKLQWLSSTLGVSRPTLDKYIKLYDNKEPFNEGIKVVFDSLCTNNYTEENVRNIMNNLGNRLHNNLQIKESSTVFLCNKCNGTGRDVMEDCDVCNGTGRMVRKVTVENIPYSEELFKIR